MNFTKEFFPIEKSQMKLSITVKQDEVQTKYTILTKKYAAQLQIPGFRKGKVPVKILEQKFGESLRAETYNEIIETVLQEVFESADKYQRPLPYSQPSLDGTPDFKLDSDMSFTVVYDVLPKTEITKTEGFTIFIPDVSISEADIEKELKLIQERNALVIDCADSDTVQNDSIVTINYAELDESDKEIVSSKRDDFVFTVGKGQFRYELDAELIGMKKGEEKIVSKTYAVGHFDTQLAGKTIKLKIVITALKKKELPAIDDELAQDVSEKYQTLTELKEDISQNLTIKVQNEIERRKINSLLEQMMEANPFELPESMIRAELEARWMMMAQQFRMTAEEFEKFTAAMKGKLSKDSAMEEWRPDTEARLKTRIIVEKLIEERDIVVLPEDVEAEYTSMAEQTRESVEEIKKHYEDNLREKEYIIDNIKEKKLYKQLFEKSTVKTDKKLSVEELFNKEPADAGNDA